MGEREERERAARVAPLLRELLEIVKEEAPAETYPQIEAEAEADDAIEALEDMARDEPEPWQRDD